MPGQFKLIVEAVTFDQNEANKLFGRGVAYQLIEFDSKAEADTAYLQLGTHVSGYYHRYMWKLYK